MSNFKVEERVVFVGGGYINPICNLPEKNEIVTISGISVEYGDSYYVSEYPLSKRNITQSFMGCHLRKLSDYGKEESEKIVAKIETEMEIIEPELV